MLQKRLSFGGFQEGLDGVANPAQWAAVGTVFICCPKPFIPAWHRECGAICELMQLAAWGAQELSPSLG